MFDWEDAELANIIWGEGGESEDHIVPYPDETYVEPANVKRTEKTTVSVTDSQENSNKYFDTLGKATTDEFGSLPDLSASNAPELNLEHKDGKAQVDNCSQSFDSQHKGRESSNFVDYDWANVGSFNDLDGILSNHDLVYGNVNSSNTEALWSSTKDFIGCPDKPELLCVDSPNSSLRDQKSEIHHVETKSGLLKDGKSTNDGLRKRKEKSASDILRRTLHPVYPISAVDVTAVADELTIGKGAHMDGQRLSLRCQTQPQTSSDSWISLENQGKELDEQYMQHIKSSSMARNQQIESSSGHNMVGNQQSVVPTFPLSMTPQEKIEKLRKRQQMRALLAIRKQQQELKNQESQNLFGKAGNMESDENPSTLLSVDVCSPLEQSDSDARSMMMMDKSSLEDTILYQLQNVIATLGTDIRLCIRDSLFRLAQSSLQRQTDGDSVDTNRRSRDENTVEEERLSSTNSSARPSHGETKTNPIDRAVAHLLFHSPPELSWELVQSTLSTKAKLPCESSSQGDTLL